MTEVFSKGRLLKGAFYAFLIILWLIGSVFLGGMVLSVKEALGINIFSSTGYHAFGSCIHSEYHKALDEQNLDVD